MKNDQAMYLDNEQNDDIDYPIDKIHDYLKITRDEDDQIVELLNLVNDMKNECL